MKKSSYRQFNKEIVGQIKKRFEDGDILTIDNLVEDYLGSQTTQLDKILSHRRAKRWIISVKRLFAREGERLCVVDENGDGKKLFGFANSEAKARYAMNCYYVLAKGVVNGAVTLHQYVRGQGLLRGRVTNETVLLPKLKGK